MKILVVEDDSALANMIRAGLVSEYHMVEIAKDGAEGSFLARNYDYDAIILDYSLPKKDGLAVCREVRKAGKVTPIIFLTVTDDIETKLAAFDCGVDDYVTKPFSLQELCARIKALARRPAAVKTPLVSIADLVFDTDQQIVRRSSKLIRLTHKELGLLEYMAKHAGVVLSRAMIMEHVWSAESDVLSNTIEAHIRNLRRKLNGRNRPDLIANIQGRGYVLDTPQNLKKLLEA